MSKVFLITYKLNTTDDVKAVIRFEELINSIGPTFKFYDNIIVSSVCQWFVKSDLTAEELYNKITYDKYLSKTILVIELVEKSISYWGKANSELWEWINVYNR